MHAYIYAYIYMHRLVVQIKMSCTMVGWYPAVSRLMSTDVMPASSFCAILDTEPVPANSSSNFIAGISGDPAALAPRLTQGKRPPAMFSLRQHFEHWRVAFQLYSTRQEFLLVLPMYDYRVWLYDCAVNDHGLEWLEWKRVERIRHVNVAAL